MNKPKSFENRDKRHFFLTSIIAERTRQRELLELGKIPWDCADPEVPRLAKIVVLGEENGECCQDALEDNDENLKEELIQLAAVACAIYESLP